MAFPLLLTRPLKGGGGTVVFTRFEDTFVESVDTLLSQHIPDIGNSWSLLWSTTAESISGYIVNAAQDLTSQVANVSNRGAIYEAVRTYLNTNYYIQATMVGLGVGATNTIYLFVRIQDVENMYGVKLTDQGGTNTCRLYKKVAGVWTALGSAFSPPADGSVIKLEIIGTSLKFYDDGVEVASATDADISGIGRAGIGGAGGAELVSAGDDMVTSCRLDNLSVVDIP